MLSYHKVAHTIEKCPQNIALKSLQSWNFFFYSESHRLLQNQGYACPCAHLKTLIDWFKIFYSAHISILWNAHGAWLMFWPVLRRCHILRWDWSVLPLGASFHFPLWEFYCMLVSVMYVSTILRLTHRDCRIFIVCAWCSEWVHQLDLGLSSYPKDARVTSPK
jgi:hypothetical protein